MAMICKKSQWKKFERTTADAIVLKPEHSSERN